MRNLSPYLGCTWSYLCQCDNFASELFLLFRVSVVYFVFQTTVGNVSRFLIVH